MTAVPLGPNTDAEQGYGGEDDDVATASMLKMWWLTKVGGYRVTRSVQVPKTAMFGRIAYERRWWLRAAVEDREKG